VPGVSGLPSAVNCEGGFHSLAGSGALCELAAAHGLVDRGAVAEGQEEAAAVDAVRAALEAGEAGEPFLK
ncbi:ROK family transcriptional regulator, partial [Streptomyces sp. SID7982]|nr:ROK family transcriptional regulator [Streptomyces sp. SID7982]